MFFKVQSQAVILRVFFLATALTIAFFIIKLKQAEEAGSARDALYRGLVESTAAIPWEFDLATQRFNYISPKVEEILGYAPAAWTDLNSWSSRIHPSDREFAVDFCMASTALSKDHEFNYRMFRADGRLIWIRDIVFVHTEKGRPTLLRGFFFDITNFKDSELEQQKLELQLRQAQKMEAIGQLAGGIAHDFNNYLTLIIGYGELLRMRTAADETLSRDVNEIITAAEKASGVTRSLLAFSRKQVLNPRPVDLNFLVDGIGKLLARILTEDIQLTIKLATANLMVQADPGQIEQVIINMATNAKDAMPKGGSFTIEVSPFTIDQDFTTHHGYGKPGKYGQITFTDTGNGMDKATQEKIFEPFFTTKEKGKGTGLGMSIVHGIIKQHEGYINVYSEKGEGTTFKILLPRLSSATAPAELTASPSAHHPVAGSANATILLAEDEEPVRRLLVTILKSEGYRVITAANGHEAVEKFRENRDRIDMLILDVIMPGLNGQEVLDQLRRLEPRVKALFMSGYTAEVIQQKGIHDKDFDFLSKPVSPRLLLDTVQRILDR
jgi:PAS domain S-box-containing protein